MNNIKLIVKLTNRAVLRSGEDIEGNQFTFDCEPGDLPGDVREQIADRLHEDAFLCKASVNDDGTVEPSVTYHNTYEEPDLLLVDGTDIGDLIKAVRQDQTDVEEHSAYRAAREQKPAA